MVARGMLLTLALAVAPALARADNYFTETHYDLGVQSVSDLSFDGGTSSGIGIHLTEHNGMLSRVPYILFMMGAGFQAGGDAKLVGGSTTTPTEHEYETKDAQGHVTDRTTIHGTSTSFSFTLVPLTAEEIKARDEHLARVGASMTKFAMLPAHFEVLYVPQRDNGKLRGIRAAIYPLAIGIGKHFEIAIGYAGARFKSEYVDPETGTMRTLKYRLRSIAGRIGVAPARWFVVTLELQPNLLDLDDTDGRYGTTVRGTAALSIPKLDRFYAKVGAERTSLAASGKWSSFLEGGMRF